MKSFTLPSRVHLEVPCIDYNLELIYQTNLLRASDAQHVRTADMDVDTLTDCSPEHTTLARIVATHFGIIPGDQEFEMDFYGNSHRLGVKERRRVFKDLIGRIRRELQGSEAFSPPFYSGMICTDNFKTLVMRHTMQAEALRVADHNETIQETTPRRAQQMEHKEAAVFLYDLYKKAYTDALVEVDRDLRSPPTEQARKQLRGKKQLYTKILGNWKIPVLSARLTPQECVSNLPEVLHMRSRAERLSFWWDIWDKHVLPSQYQEFSAIVDVQRLATDDAEADHECSKMDYHFGCNGFMVA